MAPTLAPPVRHPFRDQFRLKPMVSREPLSNRGLFMLTFVAGFLAFSTFLY